MKNISNRRPRRKLRFAAVLLSVAVAAGLAAGTRIARAASASGLMSYRNGRAAERRWLHFENRVTSDIYIAPTSPDGSFTADLPPGLYDLRAERGVILSSKIRVDTQDVYLGHVVEPTLLDVCRPFESEGVAEALVASPAPATANLTGRPLEAMRSGYEAMAPVGAPATPAPEPTPLGEVAPGSAASPSATQAPSGGY